MTNPTESDRPTATETTSEDNASRELRPESPWEHDDLVHDKPDTGVISDPPDRGVDYYNRLIDTEDCFYDYMKTGRLLEFSWQGEIHDIDDFKTALFQLYESTLNSDLSKGDLRPKAFETFAHEVVSEQLKATLYTKPTEGPDSPHDQGRYGRLTDRTAKTLSAAAVLAFDDRIQHNGLPRAEDAVLRSVLPDSAHEQSAP